jgi:O-antigen ligase
MGGLCGVGVVVTLSTPRAWRGVVVGSMVMATVLGTAIFWESILTFKRDKELDAELTAESAKLRPILATVAWHMFQDRPFLGCGFAQYREVMPEYLADRSTELPLIKARPFVQHNAFLALLTETGLIGAGLFCVVLLAWTWQAFTLWHADGLPLWEHQFGLLFLAAIGVYLPNAMFHDVSLVAMVNMFMFFLGGSAVGLALKERAAGTTANVRMAMAPWWLKDYLLHGSPGKAGG